MKELFINNKIDTDDLDTTDPCQPESTRLQESLLHMRRKVVGLIQQDNNAGGDWKNLNDFQKWLQIFWVQNDNYKITTHGYAVLSKIFSVCLQSLPAQAQSSFENTKHLSYNANFSTERDVKNILDQLIHFSEMVESLLSSGMVIAKKARWKDESVRREVLGEFFVRIKDLKAIIGDDFHDNKLGGLLVKYNGGSPYEALYKSGFAYSPEEIKMFLQTKIFPPDQLYPWELAMGPLNFFEDTDMQKAAVGWLLQRLNKQPSDIIGDDFNDNGLGALLSNYADDSPYRLFCQTGYAYTLEELRTFESTNSFPDEKLYPWQLPTSPIHLFDAPGMIRVAIKWLLNRVGNIRSLQSSHFHRNDLGGFLAGYCHGAPYESLWKAGYAYSPDEIISFINHPPIYFPSEKVYPWEMDTAPHGFFEDQQMVRGAVGWLLQRGSIRPQELTKADLDNNYLGAFFVNYCHGSLYHALVLGGYAFSFDEIKMQTQTGSFSLQKLYPWQMSQPFAYRHRVSREIEEQWRNWYKKQSDQIIVLKS